MHSETPLSPEVWERTPPEAQAYIRAIEAQVGALEVTVQRLEAAPRQLEAMIQRLREQLQQDSRTLSRPPSSDAPQALGERPRREASGRRPGGQPGHAGQTPALGPGKDRAALSFPLRHVTRREQDEHHETHGLDPELHSARPGTS
jgi:Family of unknown function (DUF6444)